MARKAKTPINYNLSNDQLHMIVADLSLPVHPIWNRPTAWSIALTATQVPSATLSGVLNLPPINIVGPSKLTIYLQRCVDGAQAIGVSPNKQKFTSSVKAGSTVQGVGDALFAAV